MTAATHAPQPNHTAADALTYLAAMVRNTVEYVVDSIPENISEADVERIDDELHQLHVLADTASSLCTERGSHDHYSDGREIFTTVELAPGLRFSNVWHPDVNRDHARSFEARVPGGRVTVNIVPPATVTVSEPRTRAVGPNGDGAA